MALPASGAISILQISSEFGGSTPHSLGEYAYVVGKTASAGQNVSMTSFYGLSAVGDGEWVFSNGSAPHSYFSFNDYMGEVEAVYFDGTLVGIYGSITSLDSLGRRYIIVSSQRYTSGRTVMDSGYNAYNELCTDYKVCRTAWDTQAPAVGD